jgi:predicted RNA binding protein YcfA (HicA-like mRNA interferase family)
MAGQGRPPKVRELISALKRIGAQAVRTRGSHQTWEWNGKRFQLVVNHPGGSCSRQVLRCVQDALGYIPEC